MSKSKQRKTKRNRAVSPKKISEFNSNLDKNGRRADGLTLGEARSLGFYDHPPKMYKTLEEIFEGPTGMVAAELIENAQLRVSEKDTIQMTKGDVYCMALSSYVDFNKNKKMFRPYKKQMDTLYTRYRGQDLNNKSLLISRSGGAGDLVYLQHILKYLKEQYPTCKITFATSPMFVSLFNCFPKGLVDQVAYIPFKLDLLNHHDYYLTFINALENNEAAHTIDYMTTFMKVAGLNFDFKNGYMPDVIVDENIRSQVKRYVLPNSILIHMHSSSQLRALAPLKWSKIIRSLNHLGYNTALIDAPRSSDRIEKFLNEFKLDRTKNRNIAQYSETCPHAVAMVDCCLGSVCIDSAFAHISCSLRNGEFPCVGLYGPFTPNVVAPSYKSLKAIVPKNFRHCGRYPCFLHTNDNVCPYVREGLYSGCLDFIDEKEVVEGIHKMILEKTLVEVT